MTTPEVKICLLLKHLKKLIARFLKCPDILYTLDNTEFSLRIFLTDYYLTKPIPQIDNVYNDFSHKEVFQVPIIRVFGTTPRGQKCCAHIHGVFPYFYVPFLDDLSLINSQNDLNCYLIEFNHCLNQALKLSMNQQWSNYNYVYRIVLVKGKQFYGYQDEFQYFLKIYLYNPFMVNKAGDLLMKGAVMNKPMQTFETHISYNLKFFIDYNLYGMNFLFTDAAKFRLDRNINNYPDFCETSKDMFVNLSQKMWNPEDIVYGNNYMDPEVCSKMTSCELEVDIAACDILNSLELEGNVGQNPGLKYLWEEEKQRRIAIGLDISELVGEVYEDRPLAKIKESERQMLDYWNGIVDSVASNEASNSFDVDWQIEDFLNASKFDDSVLESQMTDIDVSGVLDNSMFQNDCMNVSEHSHDEIDPIKNTTNDELIKPTVVDDWDDDQTMNDFIEEYYKETQVEKDLSKSTANNSDASLFSTDQSKDDNDIFYNSDEDSDNETDQLFSKTFIDLSLDDDDDCNGSSDHDPVVSDMKITHVAKDTETRHRKNSNCHNLFGDSSSSLDDYLIIESFDGADDNVLRGDDCISPSSLMEAENIPKKTQKNTQLMRSPIARRSKKKLDFTTDHILIPLLTKKLEKERRNRKKKVRLSLKLKTKSHDTNSISSTTVNNSVPNTTIESSISSTNNMEKGFHSPNRNVNSSNGSPTLIGPSFNSFLSPTTSYRPQFSTPVRTQINPITSTFMKISPINESSPAAQVNRSRKHISFSITEASQESPYSSPMKFDSVSEHTFIDEKSQKMMLLQSMRRSIFEGHHNFSGNTSLMSDKFSTSCHLTLLSAELLGNSRSDLKPNPKYDQILVFFYSVQDILDCTDDNHLANQKINSGIIYIDDGSNIMAKVGIDSNFNQNLVPTSNENELMDKIIELVWEFDPDILVGYETVRQSWGYLLERAHHIGHKLYNNLGRLLNNAETKNFGSSHRREEEFQISELHCNGRLILNLWVMMKYELSLNSYTFERSVQEVLKEKTPFYTNQQLCAWFRSNRERHLMVQYFQYRVLANIRLLDKINLISRTTEFAKIYGIEFYHVFSRGSQYRVESMMLRLAKPQNLIAISPSVQQRAKQRAPECIPLTLEPKSGLYRDPVVVLDFQSLYPSIMIAYNYCFATTIGKLDQIIAVKRNEPYELGCATMTLSEQIIQKLGSNVSISPHGVAFVRPDSQKGVISKMVEEILNTRIMIKKSMKIHAHNKALCKLLDSRQLGLKLIANVTFGYTAAGYSGRMPCVEVGESIIRKSRETLEEAIKLVNSGGPDFIAKSDSDGGWAGCKVIYGDTDSVFILMPRRTKSEAFMLGTRIADAVSAMNPFPVKLKFEKVMMPCLLQAKKRYVGMMYETPDQLEPQILAKGIETVRRDNCGIVSKILERTLHRLFASENVDSIKRYVTQELDKILRGKINMIDFIIAKEYRGRRAYKANAAIPALEIARRMSKKDPRAEPLSGDRIPYVIIQGAPDDTLISCVRRPEDILFNTKYFKSYATNIRKSYEQGCTLSYTYYITKQILPPLHRALSLVGLDVFKWYSQMPKRSKITSGFRSDEPMAKKLNRTISSYFQSRSCMLCQSAIKGHLKGSKNSLATILCSACISKGKQHIVATAMIKLKDIEQCQLSILNKCYDCSNTTPTYHGIGPLCVSKDCETFFDRIRAFQEPTSDMEQLITLFSRRL